MIRYFTRHPTAANLLMLVIIFVGVLGAVSMRRMVFPDFQADLVSVTVPYRGASAEEVEDTVCQRIEEEIEGIEGIEEITASAREGLGTVLIEVADGFEVRDVLDDVENAIEGIDNFPENSEEPIVQEVERTDQVITVSVAGRMPTKGLVAFAEGIKDDLLALDEVSLVETHGFSEHRIRIEVRQAALLALGLTIDDVAGAVDALSLDLPAGSVETDQHEIKIRMLDQRRWAEDFRDLPVVSTPNGAQIPLRAIARVTDTFEDEWDQATLNGVRCVNLQVTATDEEDIIQSARAIKAYVEQRQADLPPGVQLYAWGDWSQPVRDRLGMLVENGIAGFVLVFLTLWCLLNLRLSAWVAIGIPISFLGTLFVMHLAGLTLNLITMFSLILALGLIVDDAIVIGENVYAHRSRGKPAVQAAIDGTREVALGVIASMLTTVAVFLPLMMMTGEMGKILRVMPFGVIVALAVSLVEGFLVLPNHLGHSLAHVDPNARGNRVRQRIDAAFEWLTHRVYGRFLRWCLAHRSVFISAVVMLLMIAVGLVAGSRVEFQPFPELDGDFLVARVLLPQGTRLERTREVVERIEGAIPVVNQRFKPRQPDQQELVLAFNTLYGVNQSADETGSHVATVTVQLLTGDERDARCDDVLAAWSELVGDVAETVSLTFDQMEVTPGGKAIDIRLTGRDLDELKQASLAVQSKLATYPGVQNLMDDLRPGKREVRVRLKPMAQSLGVTSSSLAAQLRGAFWGRMAEEFQRGADLYEVEVQLHDQDRRSLADLDDFKVITAGGAQVPLGELATVELERGFAKIVRIDGRRAVSVTADVDERQANANKILEDLRVPQIKGEPSFLANLAQRFEGVSISLEGQRAETQKTLTSVGRGFLIGLVMVFVLLSFVFRSYIEPTVVMTAIPFGIVGAVFGHLVMGLDWTMPSTVGFVSLAGIVVNDAIVLVQFIKARLEEGRTIEDAIVAAGLARFRPVFLTSATTVAGLLPILAETSLQAQILIPVAVSIAFGLMFATVLVLILVPCLYSLLGAIGAVRRSAA